MKTLFLTLLLLTGTGLCAQFTGGGGQGEAENTVSSLLLNGSTAAATSLRFVVQPANTMAFKSDISPVIQVLGSNDLLFDFSGTISLAIDQNPAGGSLTGSRSVTASGGQASFSNLYINAPGNGYSLIASGTGPGNAVSDAFNVSAPVVVFSTQPGNANENESFGTGVSITDGAGNVLTAANGTVNLSISNNPGSGTLSGTNSLNASAGIASFSGLSINLSGTGYVLQASTSGSVAQSQPFNIFSTSGFKGGSGDGYDEGIVNGSATGGQKLWRGGISNAWATADNWFPSGVPAATDEIGFEINDYQHQPVLDQNRVLRSLDFSGAGKHLHLGNHLLTITGKLFNGDSMNYAKTTASGALRSLINPGNTISFPVGNSAYNPVNITNNTASADTFGARVMDEVYVNGTSGAVFNRDPRIRRSWDISKTSGNSNSGSGVDFVFYWNSGEDTLSPSQLFLSHYDGSSWTQLSGSATVSGNSLSYNGYMGSFSPFAINGNRPLPVSWLYVRGQCEGLQSRIEWATAAEINNRRFVTEGSRNGNDWYEVRETIGKGHSSSTETYQEIIHSNYPYIRIRQEDFDGTQAYSETIYLPCVQGPAEVAVVPNPSEGIFRILGGEWLKSYVLINAFGQKVSEGETGALPEWRLDLSSLEKGIYSLRMLGEGAEVLRKIVLQ